MTDKQKQAIGMLTSFKLVEHFDSNNDGKVSFKEFWKSPISAKIDVALKYGYPLFELIKYVVKIIL